MNRQKSLFGVAIVLFLVGPAEAQWVGKAWRPTTQLSAQDLALMRAAVQRGLHGKAVGAVANWTNPASNHSGTVTLLKKFHRQSIPCEQIEYRITSSSPTEPPERYVFTSCRLSDGTWKLAD